MIVELHGETKLVDVAYADFFSRSPQASESVLHGNRIDDAIGDEKLPHQA